MRKLPNTQRINTVSFDIEVIPYCPIGEKHYTAEIHCTIEPDKEIFEFIELEKELKELEGQTLLVEDCADRALELLKHCNPYSASVKVNAKNAGHFDVSIEKKYFREY